MKIELINTKEEFEKLEKGELILVKWDDYFVKHTPKTINIMLYAIYENKASHEEIICQRKDNHYFNYDRHLQGLSSALEVYKVISM